MTIKQGWCLGMIKKYCEHLLAKLGYGAKAMPTKEKGMILVTIILIAGFLTVVGIALMSVTIDKYQVTRKSTYSANAMLVAEAGIEQSIKQLNADDNFTGYTTPQQFFDNTYQGKGLFTTTISSISGSSNAKAITSTGSVYRNASSTEPISTKIVKVTVVGTQSQGHSVQSGPGGIILGGAASILNSDVYINGTLKLSGGSRIGTNTQPVNVFVANQACPTGSSPGPTYPIVCASPEPISLGWATYIYGTVCATGQVSKGPSGANILPGSTGQGLKPGCIAPPVSMPTYDKAGHIARVANTSASNNNTYVCNQWPFDRTWPANLKLTGNVHLSGVCNVKLKGDIYITGNFTMDGSAKITVDDALGSNRPTIITDGKITMGGASQLVANQSGTGINFISFKSSAPCNPNCTTLSGNNLKTSSEQETVNVGGGAILPGMSFNAYWGKITITGAGNIGAAMGQTIDMSGSGTITFGTGLSSGSKTWTISSYQQKFPGKP